MRPSTASSALLLLLSGCAVREAKDLLDQVRDEDYRTTWARAPGWEQPRTAGTGPHGAYVDIWVNDVMQVAIDAGTAIERWPEGSIVAKDGYNDAEGDDLKYIALMERRGGGWFFAEFSDDDRVVIANENASKCTRCHDDGADGVLAFGLPG